MLFGACGKMKEVGWHCILETRAAGGIVVMWREDRFMCKDMVKGDFSMSCLFECWWWFPTGVYRNLL